ncbi:MAG TPA: tetratricopeptide repeat protein, partial [Roseiflexaceae bacterium]|nr:tetratricopeptide repeat protein [Roseiflexaceae bacterium]
EGLHEEALDYFRKSYCIKNKSLGDVHESLVDSLHNISEAESYLNEETESIKNLSQALKMSMKLMSDRFSLLAAINFIFTGIFLITIYSRLLPVFFLLFLVITIANIALIWKMLVICGLAILSVAFFKKRWSIVINKFILLISVYFFVGFIFFGMYFFMVLAFVLPYHAFKNARIVVMIRAYVWSVFAICIYTISETLRKSMYLFWRGDAEDDL